MPIFSSMDKLVKYLVVEEMYIHSIDVKFLMYYGNESSDLYN